MLTVSRHFTWHPYSCIFQGGLAFKRSLPSRAPLPHAGMSTALTFAHLGQEATALWSEFMNTMTMSWPEDIVLQKSSWPFNSLKMSLTTLLQCSQNLRMRGYDVEVPFRGGVGGLGEVGVEE